MVQNSTIVTASVATAATAIIGKLLHLLNGTLPLKLRFKLNFSISSAYAAYFDYQRRSQPEFRRNIRRNERRQVRAEKEEAEASTKKQREAIKAKVDEANAEGFPNGVEDREAYFNEQVMAGEVLSSDRASTPST
jgi:import receptor subunit TOM20